MSTGEGSFGIVWKNPSPTLARDFFFSLPTSSPLSTIWVHQRSQRGRIDHWEDEVVYKLGPDVKVM